MNYQCFMRNSNIYIYDWRTGIRYHQSQSRFWESKWIGEFIVNSYVQQIPDTLALMITGGLPDALGA